MDMHQRICTNSRGSRSCWCSKMGRGNAVLVIDVKKTFFTFFIIFIKNAFFNVFLFLERFYFLVGFLKLLLNLLNSYIKQLSSDGFNGAAIENSLMKSHIALKRCHAHYNTLRQ